jgi:hypothetical protein
MNIEKNKAIDLMIEDLHTANHRIICMARGQGCERELESIKQQLIDYLNFLRKMP